MNRSRLATAIARANKVFALSNEPTTVGMRPFLSVEAIESANVAALEELTRSLTSVIQSLAAVRYAAFRKGDMSTVPVQVGIEEYVASTVRNVFEGAVWEKKGNSDETDFVFNHLVSQAAIVLCYTKYGNDFDINDARGEAAMSEIRDVV